ncbi:M16 family metallopeptidase [Vulgatibacter incomptus]|uniref:Zinc protease n=1 Tax=Vulgatibacter incomptus TaxID=1391653 RepID=A0A0K1PFC3_9BACT|nr:pitrilysin family protein [Vulgatibacter incomptus]AKU92136.1 Zinc protease [Vulgatibacter incomptus]
MQYRLPNGLTVILEQNRAAPVVALQAWVQVGSADESDREAGLAHLHEHMLFKGTNRRGPGEIARDIESRGGEVNAWTSFDQTVYHLTIASSFFEEGLEVLTDQVRDSVFDPDELSREIEVVIEEIKRAGDMPSRRASRALFESAYTAHTYGRPVIGFPETVRSFTRDDVLGFYRRHYTPDNVALVIVGDFDPEKARARIDALWGDAKGRHGGRHARTPEPEPTGFRTKVMREAVQETHLALAWPIPHILSDDLVALDLAAAVLGNGDSARLVQEVKRDRHLCNEIYSYAYTPKDPGLFVVGAALRHEQAPATIREALRQVYRLRAEGPSGKELEVAKHLVESEQIWQRETVQGVARKLGFYETVTGSLDFERRYYEALRSVTSDQIRDVCDRFLRSSRLNAILLGGEELPLGEEEVAAIAEEEERGVPSRRQAAAAPPPRPAAAAEVPPTFPKKARTPGAAGIFRERLASGATVLVKPEPSVPVVAVRAAFLGGLRFEDERTNGINHLLARTITKGTGKRSAKELAALSDELAASFVGASGRNSFGFRGDFLATKFEPAFRLFAECLRDPGFGDREVERERALQLEEIRTRDDSPASVAFDLFSRALYTRHPYRFDPLGTAESLAAFDPAAIGSWYEGRYGADNLVLSIVGDVEPNTAFGLAEELFGEWASKRATPPVVGIEPSPAEARRASRQMDKQQAHLILGFLGARFQDPERHALGVLASVLAGQGGRLFFELRDKRSMAYSVTAFNLEGIDHGYFGVYIGTSPEKLADAEAGIRDELAKVIAQPITDEELLRAQRYLVGSHAIGLQRNDARAASIALDEAYGLGAESFSLYRERIEAVTREQVQDAAKRYLDLDRSVVAVVSPSA